VRSRLSTSTVLALFWFLYTGALGIFFPYFSLYLRENAGLTPSQVGMVLAVGPLVGLVAQPLWGQLADRSGDRSRVLAALTFGTAVGFLALGGARGFAALVAASVLTAFFATSMIPMTVSVTLAQLRDAGRAAFGIARAWGTVGFLLLVVAFPMGLDRLASDAPAPPEGAPSQPDLGWMFPASAAFAVAAALVSLLLPRGGAGARRAERGDARALLRHGPMLRLLVLSFGTYFFLQGPIHLFPLLVRELGGDIHTLSRLWILMLALEIPLVALSGATLARLGPRGLLAMALVASGLRWTVSAWTGDFRLFAALQLLHGPVVAGLLGGPLYVEAAVPARLGSTGQALLAAVGVGLGGILSQLASGVLLEHGGARALYLASGLGALVLAALLPALLPPAVRPDAPIVTPPAPPPSGRSPGCSGA
jgi:PPP family 3-phenylpropionic acid transporter